MTAPTPEDRLIRSVTALRALIDSLAGRSPSEAKELLQLDLLVRRYPAAARASLRLDRRAATGPPPPGWSPASDTAGVPLWRWNGGGVCVASPDTDQLRYLDVALHRFDRMTAEELHAYLRARIEGRPS